MTWRTTTDAAHLLRVAGACLASDPVAHTPLLTEADHWRRSGTVPGARGGWWEADGRVGAAWVHLPGHPPLCSVLPPDSVDSLVDALGDEEALAVDSRDVQSVLAAWRLRDADASVGRRIPILRLAALRDRPAPEGAARIAGDADRGLLHDWFSEFRRRAPEDPSDRAYVVDHPLDDGAVLLWEVDGRPLAMASRTPTVAGVTRLGLAFQPAPGHEAADAAFHAACVEAPRRAGHVVVLGGSAEATAALTDLGFEQAAERVLLVRPRRSR